MNPQFFTAPGMLLLLISCWYMNYRPDQPVPRNWYAIAGGLLFAAGAVLYRDPWLLSMEAVFLWMNVQGLWKLRKPAQPPDRPEPDWWRSEGNWGT